MSEAPPVAVVGGRYRLSTCIGQGGMGSVWRAEHMSLRTPVAVKFLDPGLAKQEGLRSRFVREARAAAALQGDDVVRILDHGEEEGLPYIVMEFLEGESLGDKLGREGAITPTFAGHVMAAVCRAIARAHRAGIVHRDLKPDNIFLVRGEAQLPQVKVLDFGIAKVLAEAGSLAGSSAPTATGNVVGTPYYMGQEQIRGTKELDRRADLWSLAVIAFECLTGRRPFDSESMGDLVLKICHEPVPVPSHVGPVPSGFDAWFSRATDRALEARFQTVQELAASLAELLTPGRPWFDDAVARAAGMAPTERVSAVDPRASTQRTTAHSVHPTEAPRSQASRIGIAAVAVLAVGAGVFALSRKPTADASSTAMKEASAEAPTTPRSTERGAGASPPTTAIEASAPSASAVAIAPSASASSAPSAGAAPSTSTRPTARLPNIPAPPAMTSAKPKPSTGFTGVD
ncbi:MAG: serine/threonine-protein kinase [Polyangiaceae bacterium]